MLSDSSRRTRIDQFDLLAAWPEPEMRANHRPAQPVDRTQQPPADWKLIDGGRVAEAAGRPAPDQDLTACSSPVSTATPCRRPVASISAFSAGDVLDDLERAKSLRLDGSNIQLEADTARGLAIPGKHCCSDAARHGAGVGLHFTVDSWGSTPMLGLDEEGKGKGKGKGGNSNFSPLTFGRCPEGAGVRAA